jgi:hypothetical protein
MIALPLMSPYLSRRMPKRSTAVTGRESEHRDILPGERPARIIACFQPLDPDIVSEAIPAFFIGRNKEGFWVARDVKGRIGGIFLLESSALSFARKNSWPLGCATILSSDRFELDLENNGNPRIELLGSLLRFARRPLRRLAAFIGQMTEAVKRLLSGIDAV